MSADEEIDKCGADQDRLTAASRWLVELQNSEMSVARSAEWLKWTEADDGNLRAFDRVEALATAMRNVDAHRKQELLAKFVLTEKAPFVERAPTRRRSTLLRHAGASVAAGLLVLAVGVLLRFGQESVPLKATYVTERSERRELELSDGTRVTLGAATHLDVHFTDRERRVDLLRGDAYFSVGKPGRAPFAVYAGGLHITDVGTRFDVRNNGERVAVTVAEGIVDVREISKGVGVDRKRDAPVLRLKAGERVRTQGSGEALSLAKVTHVDVRDNASWRSGRLDFEDETLAAVISEVNRYASRDIVIVNPDVARMRFTGTVFQDRIEDWLTATSRLFSLRTDQSADGRVLLYGNDSSHLQR